MSDETTPAPRIPPVPWIALAAFLLCLPFLGSLPFMDPDEAFYPATAAESMESGDALDLRLNGEPRWVKPPGQYALIQVSFALLGKSEFAARLVPVIEGALLVLLLGLLVKRLAGDLAGRLSALVLASTLAHTFYSRAAHPEMALALGTAAGTLYLACWILEDRPPKWLVAAAGAALGFAFVAKGPVCLVPPLLMILVGLPLLKAEVRPSWKRALAGFGVAAVMSVAIAAPWFLWMGAKHGDVFWDTVFGQLGHLTSDEFARDNSSVFYFVPVLLAGSLPWLGVLPQSLRRVKRGDAANRERLRTLMAATLLGTFVFFSLSSAQRPNYGLHFFPPLAVIVGLWLEEVVGGKPQSPRPLLAPALTTLFLLATFGYGAYRIAMPIPELAPATNLSEADLIEDWIQKAMVAMAGLALCLICVLAAVPTFLGTLRHRLWALVSVGALLLPSMLVGVWWRANLREHVRWVPQWAAQVRSQDGSPDDFAIYRRRLPSFTFYLGREVPWPHSEEELRAYLDQRGRPWLVVQSRHLELLDGARFETMAHADKFWLVRRKTPEPGGMK